VAYNMPGIGYMALGLINFSLGRDGMSAADCRNPVSFDENIDAGLITQRGVHRNGGDTADDDLVVGHI
jgi:hypothetical protein